MIYKLQKKFILICTVSVLTVIALVFTVILVLNISSMNRNMDMLADRVSEGGGRFPGSMQEKPHPDKAPPQNKDFEFITSETPFSTRHFTVLFSKNGSVLQTFMESIFSIPEGKAIEYAQSAADKEAERGWIYNYRYKVFPTEMGYGVVLVDGSMSRSVLMQSTTIAGLVLLGCAALVLLLIVLLSKRVVKPIAESYEKQKQFITDANHELKTPLTLILANLDIAEAELGQNEWLEDIRSEGHRMTELVNRLVALSRMDEDDRSLNMTEISLTDIVTDAASEFKPLADLRKRSLTSSIEADVRLKADETLIKQLISILLDNAVKYCDDGGEIAIKLEKRRRAVLTVENTYTAVKDVELNKLFDRFYRADKARTYAGGYGIGLSMAKAIAEKHKGEITAYKKDSTHIGFKIVM